MALTTQYIASQIVTIFVYVFLASTYCLKNRKAILICSFISNFLNAIAFILLNSYTSAAMCAISIFRDFIFMIDQKINGKSDKITKKDIALLVFIYGICAVSIVLTYKGPLSLLYAAGSMLYTFSIWQKNTRLYRFLGIPVTLIVICDSINIKSVFGVILQSIVLVTSIRGYIANTKTKETVDKIVVLNKENSKVVNSCQ